MSAAVTPELVDLEPGDPRLSADVLPVLRELRPHLTAELFDTVYREGYPQGLRFTAAYVTTEGSSRCVGVAGWRIVATTWVIRKLYVDDLVTTSTARSSGIGKALLDSMEERAKAAGCTALDLDSNVQRHHAHRFYLRERMAITAHHFTKQLD